MYPSMSCIEVLLCATNHDQAPIALGLPQVMELCANICTEVYVFQTLSLLFMVKYGLDKSAFSIVVLSFKQLQHASRHSHHASGVNF
jgi:hypothetical protein